MNKLGEKTLDLLFEKYAKTREVSRDNYQTAIYDVDGFRKELMEVLELIYPTRPSLPNMFYKGISTNE